MSPARERRERSATRPVVHGHGQDPPRGEPRVVVTVTHEALDVTSAVADVADPTSGGIGLFTGAVRNHHAGDTVTHLEYEAWDREVEPALHAVASRVLENHPSVRAVHLSHRLGRLEIGELSVIVAASAPHRAEALAATRDLIDDLKATVPIWKKEWLADGTSRWSRCDV